MLCHDFDASRQQKGVPMSRTRRALIVVVACAAFFGLAPAQESQPRLFLWMIEGLVSTGHEIEVTVTPTRFGQVKGLTVTALELLPLPAADDPHPGQIAPTRSKTTPLTDAFIAWFPQPTRRFQLRVTLSDGTTHDIDVFKTLPKGDSEPKDYTIPKSLKTDGLRWCANPRP